MESSKDLDRRAREARDRANRELRVMARYQELANKARLREMRELLAEAKK